MASCPSTDPQFARDGSGLPLSTTLLIPRENDDAEQSDAHIPRAIAVQTSLSTPRPLLLSCALRPVVRWCRAGPARRQSLQSGLLDGRKVSRGCWSAPSPPGPPL